jgi:hypothetical protein
MLVSLLFALFFPHGLQWEGSMKMVLTRVVAGAVPLGQRQLVGIAVPYRHNRCYIRLALVGV